MVIITVGIDLAKNVLAVHGVDESGKAVLVKPKVARDQLLLLIAQLPPLGSLFRSPPLGAQVPRLRAYSEADCPELRDFLPDEWQAQ